MPILLSRSSAMDGDSDTAHILEFQDDEAFPSSDPSPPPLNPVHAPDQGVALQAFPPMAEGGIQYDPMTIIHTPPTGISRIIHIGVFETSLVPKHGSAL